MHSRGCKQVRLWNPRSLTHDVSRPGRLLPYASAAFISVSSSAFSCQTGQHVFLVTQLCHYLMKEVALCGGRLWFLRRLDNPMWDGTSPLCRRCRCCYCCWQKSDIPDSQLTAAAIPTVTHLLFCSTRLHTQAHTNTERVARLADSALGDDGFTHNLPLAFCHHPFLLSSLCRSLSLPIKRAHTSTKRKSSLYKSQFSLRGAPGSGTFFLFSNNMALLNC